MKSILFSLLVMGGIGAIFGVILLIADKKFAVAVDERVRLVREAVAGANCGACGYPGCDAFAEAVVRGEAPVNGCTPGGAQTTKALADIMGQKTGAEEEKVVVRVLCQGKTGICKERYTYAGLPSCHMAHQFSGGPKACAQACIGLGDCVAVCKFNAMRLQDTLVLIDPKQCTACGMCASVCPRHVIKMLPQKKNILVACQNSRTTREAREACTRGCIACKRCEKACQFDAIHVSGGFATIDPQKCTLCEECVKVCPCDCIIINE